MQLSIATKDSSQVETGQIYSSSYPGAKTSTREFAQLSISKDTLRGFFLNEDIISMIQSPHCAGVRFYNTLDPISENSLLVAVAVKENGCELTDRHIASHAVGTSKYDQPVRVLSREEAKTIGEAGQDALIPANHLATFFSKKILLDLVSKKEFPGLSFYEVSLSNISDEKLPLHISSLKGLLDTHIAIPSSLDRGSVVLPKKDSKSAEKGVISAHPCPGHCINFDRNGNIIRSFSPPSSIDNFWWEWAPYLVKWEKT